jgi:hypothetical protein
MLPNSGSGRRSYGAVGRRGRRCFLRQPGVRVGLTLWACGMFALGGCGRGGTEPPPSPTAAAPATATPVPSPAADSAAVDSAPAVALRDFWRERDAGKWHDAYAHLSKDSRTALPEKELREQAAASAPTKDSGAAWAALFAPEVAAGPQRLPTVEEGSGAQVEVATPGGPAVVRLVREAGAWKIDLLRTLSSP